MIDKEKVLTGLKCCSMNGSGCKRCPYNKDCDEMPDYGNAYLCSDALELLKEQQETITSLQGTICKLNAALAEQPEQKFFVDSDGKMTPLPVQKHGHWIVHGGRIKKNVDNRIVKCTVCNNFLSMSGVNGGRGNANYCPNCGAKMDGKVEQDG